MGHSKPKRQGSSGDMPKPNPDEVIFAKLAVKMGFVTKAQLRECLVQQDQARQADRLDPLPFLLLDKGYIESDQIQKIRDAEKNVHLKKNRRPSGPKKTQPAPPTPSRPDVTAPLESALKEAAFLDALEKTEFISPENLSGFLADYEARLAEGKGDPLGFSLFEKGLITTHQLQHLNDVAKKNFATPDIPGFELRGEIGRSALGILFHAYQVSLQRDVTIKVVPKSVFCDGEFKDRFLADTKTAAQLNHDHIVKVIDAGQTASFHYFAVEPFEGRTLADILEERKTLPEAEVLHYGLQAAAALKHASDNGLTHRDIRPGNLLIDLTAKTLKIANVGLVKSVGDDDSHLKTTPPGLPTCAAPEQVGGPGMIDTRTDIYGLGASFYHALTGVPVFRAQDARTLVKKILDDLPEPPIAKNSAVSAEMTRIVLKMLEKDQNQRYATADRLIEDLARLRKGGPKKATAATARGGSGETPKVVVRKRGGISGIPLGTVAAMAAAAVALLVLGFVFLGGGGGDDSGKPGPKPGKGGAEEPDDPDDRPEVDPREAEAMRLFEDARSYAQAHPDDLDEIIDRYSDIVNRFRGTPVHTQASEAVARFKDQRETEADRSLTQLITKARGLADDERFRQALDSLSEYPKALLNPIRQDAIDKAQEELRERAVSARDRRVRLARDAAARGDLEKAVEQLEAVERFGMPGLFNDVKDQIEGYRREMKTSRFLSIHRTLLDTIARDGLDRGLAFLGEELAKTDDFDLKDFIRKDIVNLDRAKSVRMAVISNVRHLGDDERYNLADGELVVGKLRVDGQQLKIKGPGGEKSFAISELSCRDVHRLSGAAALPMCAYAWYVHKNLRFILDLAGPDGASGKGEMGGLIGLAMSISKASVNQAIDDVLAGKSGREAAIALLRHWDGMPLLRNRENQLRAFLSRPDPAADPFLFGAGPGMDDKGVIVIHDNFTSSSGLSRWVLPGSGRWSAGGGTCRQEASAAGLVEAYLPGKWKNVRARAVVMLAPDSQGVGFTFHRQIDSVRFAFEVQSHEKGIRAAFYVRPPGVPVMRLLGAPVIVEDVDFNRPHVISLETREDRFNASFDDTHLSAGRADFKALSDETLVFPTQGRFGIRASTPTTFSDFQFEGQPQAGWSASLPQPDLYQALADKGKAVVFDGNVLRGFETIAGNPGVMSGALRLPAPHTAVRLASDLLLDGARGDVECRFKARRTGAQGQFMLGFLFAGRPRLIAVADGGTALLDPLDPEVVRVDMVVGNGWHDMSYRAGKGGVSLWIDGTRRYSGPAPELIEWQGSPRHLWGFSFGSAGGDWEVQDVTLLWE